VKARAGRVYGFEADVDLVANLLRSLRLRRNAALNVSMFSLAVSNVDGTGIFQISKFSRALNKLQDVGKWNDSSVLVKEVRSVCTMRIDTLSRSLPPPTIMKIDVAGAEIKVLEGAEETIAKNRPVILIEGPRELWEPMAAFFKKHDYLLLDGAAEDPLPLSVPVWDTVAVPRDRWPVAGRRTPRLD
jgi:FkbM family methyltransferase